MLPLIDLYRPAVSHEHVTEGKKIFPISAVEQWYASLLQLTPTLCVWVIHDKKPPARPQSPELNGEKPPSVKEDKLLKQGQSIAVQLTNENGVRQRNRVGRIGMD